MTILLAEFESATPALQQEQTCALDSKATGIGTKYYYGEQI
jgi:hypothetical protein